MGGSMKLEQHLVFNIPPKPASRPRVTRFGTYYSKTYTNYKKDMQQLIDKMRIDKYYGLIRVSMKFYMPIPKDVSKKKRLEMDGLHCDVGGDIDNLQKAVYDALNTIAWSDDKQIVSIGKIDKVYSVNPRTEITVEEIFMR